MSKFSTRLAYGVGDLGPAMADNLRSVFFFYFLTSSGGLSPSVAGAILMISNACNAIATPLVGIASDRTRSSWGRRRVWMLGSAPLMGLSFVLCWWIPPLAPAQRALYYLSIASIQQASTAAFLVPYSALLTEITRDSEEHVKLNAWRFIGMLCGSIGSLVLMQILSDRGQTLAERAIFLGIASALAVVVSVIWCSLGTRESQGLAGSQGRWSWQEVISLTQNKPLLFLLGVFTCSWAIVQITPAILPYFIVNNLQLGDAAIAPIILTLKVASLVGLILWEPIGRYTGKRGAYWSGATLWAIVNLGILFISPADAPAIYFLVVAQGFGMGVAYLIPPSLLPEVIDWDELQTGQRREGLLNALLLLSSKLAVAISLYLCGVLLENSGFQEGLSAAEQPHSALLAIQQLCAYLPTALLGLSLILSYLYPLTPALHRETLSLLERRSQVSPLPARDDSVLARQSPGQST